MPGKNHFISPPAAAALGPALKALEEKNYPEALKLATAYLSDTNQITSLEASKVAAAAYFNVGNFAAAAPLFKKIAEADSTPHNWLSVLTSQTLAKEHAAANKTLHIIERVCEEPAAPAETEQPTFAFVLYYFVQALCDTQQFEQAAIELARLKTLCVQYQSSTEVPPLKFLLELALRVAKGLGQKAELHTWLETLLPHVAQDQQNEILKLKNKLPQ